MTDHAEVMRIAEGLDAVPETGADPALIQEAADALRRQSAEIERFRRLVEASQAHREWAALKAEIERLRAELEALRNQEPTYWGPRCAINGGYTTFVAGMFKVNPTDVPLYLSPGAQPAPSAPDVDSIVDLMSEFATHDIERGKMEFDKWTLREAVEAAITEAPKRKPLTDKQLREVLEGTNYMVRNAMHGPFWPEFEQACRAVEAAHGIEE